jgi:hypothetical protein
MVAVFEVRVLEQPHQLAGRCGHGFPCQPAMPRALRSSMRPCRVMPVILPDRPLGHPDSGCAAAPVWCPSSSSYSLLVVVGSAQVGMLGVAPFVNGHLPALITVVFQDVVHMAVLAGADLQVQHASRLQSHLAVALGHRQPAKAGAVAVLRMQVLGHHPRRLDPDTHLCNFSYRVPCA